jgi:hypothetical protein
VPRPSAKQGRLPMPPQHISKTIIDKKFSSYSLRTIAGEVIFFKLYIKQKQQILTKKTIFC